jgi:phosphoribosylaminoimidazole-succinocarboxamide synthase
VIDLSRTLPAAPLPLPGFTAGKVRDCYDLPGPPAARLLVATDRLSAFDRVIAVIPHKGAVLTACARFWFDATADLCPNHVLGFPDPNVTLARRVAILPVEIVVRGYLAGSTSTSLLTMYRAGVRQAYGHRLPEGLRANEPLPAPLVTPTTKAADGGHDEPLSAADILARGLLTADQWEEVQTRALALFARGQQMAAARGLILADTKYEFGVDEGGRLLLADEMHTPDSSRWWRADGYAAALSAGTRPPSFDKDVIRAWVADRCDPYRDALPEVPAAMIAETARTYIAAAEAITGAPFVPDLSGATVLDRVTANLSPFIAAAAP